MLLWICFPPFCFQSAYRPGVFLSLFGPLQCESTIISLFDCLICFCKFCFSSSSTDRSSWYLFIYWPPPSSFVRWRDICEPPFRPASRQNGPVGNQQFLFAHDSACWVLSFYDLWLLTGLLTFILLVTYCIFQEVTCFFLLSSQADSSGPLCPPFFPVQSASVVITGSPGLWPASLQRFPDVDLLQFWHLGRHGLMMCLRHNRLKSLGACFCCICGRRQLSIILYPYVCMCKTDKGESPEECRQNSSKARELLCSQAATSDGFQTCSGCKRGVLHR